MGYPPMKSNLTEDELARPLTAEEEALLRESTDPQYRRLPMPERALVARLPDALRATPVADTAGIDAARLAEARKEMENRYDDLRWCNKDDDCHTKAEGARLAIDDFDSVLAAAALRTPKPEGER